MNKIIYDEIRDKIKFLVKEGNEISLDINYEIGKLIFENSQAIPKLIQKLSYDLTFSLGEGFSSASLDFMRQYYKAYKDSPELLPLTFKVSWKSNIKLFKIKDINQRQAELLKLGNKEKTPVSKTVKEARTFNQIKIKRLTLQSIKLFNNLIIDFSDNTCIIGANGSGKSTILRSLALGMCANKLSKEEKEKFLDWLQIKRFDENGKELIDENGKILIEYSIDNKDFKTEIELYLNERRKCDIKILSKVETIKSGSELKSLIIGFTQNRLQVAGTNANEMPPIKPHIIDIFPVLFQLDRPYSKQVAEWIIFLMKNNQTKVVDFIFKIFTEITGVGIYFHALTSDIIIKTPENPNGIYLSYVSQGYQDLIGWIGYFIQRMWLSYKSDNSDFESEIAKMPAICFVDEVDNYLHPAWQRRILSTLTKYFTNTQFIVTTHSPIIAAECKPEQRVILQFDKNQRIVAVNGTAPEGVDVNDILLQDFGLNSAFGTKGQELWKRYIELKQQIHFEEDESKKIQLMNEYFEIGTQYNFGSNAKSNQNQ